MRAWILLLLLAGGGGAREEGRRGRVRRLHLPGQRTEEQGSARGRESVRRQWIDSYSDLLPSWGQQTTQATASTSTTEASPSLLMSFLGDLVPYFHTTASEQERGDKTVGDSDATLVDGDGEEIEPRDTGGQAAGQIHPQIRRRLGYAADGHRIRSGQAARRKFRPRVRLGEGGALRLRRRTTSTTPETFTEPSQPVLQVSAVPEESPAALSQLEEFCDLVIGTITDSVSSENFQKVTMYQDIWYLISKYNIPVEDHSVDIIILIDELCNKKEDERPKAEEVDFDNQIDTGPAQGFVYTAPSLGKSGGRRPPSMVTKGLPVPPFGRPMGWGDSSYPGPAVAKAVTATPLLSASYPRVVAYTPRQEEMEPQELGEEAPSFLLPSPTARPLPAQPARLPDTVAGAEVITLYPELDIRHMERQGYQVLTNQPQDVIVSSGFSFGGAREPALSRGAVANINNHKDTIDHQRDNMDNNRNTMDNHAIPNPSLNTIQTHVNDRKPGSISGFSPSELMASSRAPSIVLTTPPSLRRGTVESLPRPLPTLPPIVRTHSLSKQGRKELYYPPPTLQGVEQYEEPSRSSEEQDRAPSPPLSRHSPQYVPSPGYFPAPSSGALPQQREPYPYQSLPRPYMSPNLSPPHPLSPYPRSPSSAGMGVSRESYNREEGAAIMANKMDDMRLIDAYIDTPVALLPGAGMAYSGSAEAEIQDRQDQIRLPPPRLSALTLEQLSLGLGGGTTTPSSNLRNYTQFDMADAVAVTSSLPLASQLSNHKMEQRPAFTTYSTDSATAASRPSWVDEEYYTQRPEEGERSVSSRLAQDSQLLVDSPQQMTQEDLMFLYNITFLTDTETEASTRPQRQSPYAMVGPDYVEYPALYDPDPEDYPVFPLEKPQPKPLEQESFSEAIEELLAEYDTYSKTVQERGSEMQEQEGLEVLEGLLGSQEYDYRELLEETQEDDEEEEMMAGHHVNHRTHAVPEFANKLIRGRLGEDKKKKTPLPPLLPMPGFRFTLPPTTTTSSTTPSTTSTVKAMPMIQNIKNEKIINQNINLESLVQQNQNQQNIDQHKRNPQSREKNNQRQFNRNPPILNHQNMNQRNINQDILNQHNENHHNGNHQTANHENGNHQKANHQNANHKNHKSVFSAPLGSQSGQEAWESRSEGVREVLMVLNATGKISNSKEIRDGYYPESKESQEEETEVSGDGSSDYSETVTMALDTPDYQQSHAAGADDIDNTGSGSGADDPGTIPVADLVHTSVEGLTETTTETVEYSSFYPMSSVETPEATTESMSEVYDNLSNLVDTWDENTNVYEDQVAKDLADLNREIAALEAQEAREKKLFRERDEDFPLKSYISEPTSDMKLEATLATAQGQQGLNPEKLAYILIGVCCGLSILCLIVVAVSIGYKSETHYRLEEPQRKRIRLLKASNGSDEDSSSGGSSREGTGDRSRAKLGNWFTGKHTIQTMDRKSNLVFPTSVYLDNLASSATHSTLSRSQSSGSDSPSPSGSNGNLFEQGREAEREGSMASITSVQTDPNLVEEEEEEQEPVPRRTKPVGAAVSKSSYAVSASRLSGTLSGNERSGRESRYRVLSQTPVQGTREARRNSTVTTVSQGQEKAKEVQEITWSTNKDRLI